MIPLLPLCQSVPYIVPAIHNVCLIHTFAIPSLQFFWALAYCIFLDKGQILSRLLVTLIVMPSCAPRTDTSGIVCRWCYLYAGLADSNFISEKTGRGSNWAFGHADTRSTDAAAECIRREVER